MSASLPTVLNRTLDFTAVGSYVIKSFTIYVVVFHTPKKMRHFANLLLNGILWNFTANVLYSLAHMIPMMPAECFRLDGILSAFFESEFAGHLFFKLVMLTAMNTCIALFLSFQFRYMEVVHSARISKFHPAWGYVYCFIVHVVNFVIYMVVLDNWSVSVSDYPQQSQIPDRERLFCYKPYGVDKNIVLIWFFATIFLIFVGISFFSVRSFHHLNQKHPQLHEKTIRLQRQLLRNLVYLTLVPLILGGIPLFLVIAVVFFNELTEARLIISICMVLLLNHGTLYGCTILAVFKNYRAATCRILLGAIRKITKTKIGIVPHNWAQKVVIKNSTINE